MLKKSFVSIYYLLFLVFLDQIIKYAINRFYPGIMSINKGIIFGFISNIYVVIVLTLLGLIVLYFLYKNDKNNIGLPIIFILAGAIGNIIDRLVYGGVLDYINIYDYSRFNLADIYIFTGVILYFWSISRKDHTVK